MLFFNAEPFVYLYFFLFSKVLYLKKTNIQSRFNIIRSAEIHLVLSAAPLFTHLSCRLSAGWPASFFSFSFHLFSPRPPLDLSGFSSASPWSSPSTQRIDRHLISCLQPAWKSPPPVTRNATRQPHVRTTGTCGVSWHMRLYTRVGSSLRLPLASMATTPALTPVQPTPLGLQARPRGHASEESARSLAMMGVLASLGRTSCLNIHSQWLSSCPLDVPVHWWETVMFSQLLIVFTMVKTTWKEPRGSGLAF